jgi:hypothetical protein
MIGVFVTFTNDDGFQADIVRKIADEASGMWACPGCGRRRSP